MRAMMTTGVRNRTIDLWHAHPKSGKILAKPWTVYSNAAKEDCWSLVRACALFVDRALWLASQQVLKLASAINNAPNKPSLTRYFELCKGTFVGSTKGP